MKIAYTHGRFQPLHNGQFQTILNLFDQYDKVVVGIANPLRKMPEFISELSEDTIKSITRARSQKQNPYTYLQRYEMLEKSFLDNKIPQERFQIIPHFGYYEQENWKDFFPEDATICLHLKDAHHKEKFAYYESLGYKTQSLEKSPGFYGTKFDKEFPDGNWRSLVASGTIEVIERFIVSKLFFVMCIF
jgi:hypothetical protein